MRALHATPVELASRAGPRSARTRSACRRGRSRRVGPSSGSVASQTIPAAPSSTDLGAPIGLAHVGLHEARAGRVDQHAVALELGREDARHRVERGLRHPVAGRPAAHLGHPAHPARHVHDPRVLALAQQRQQRHGQPVGAEEVGVERRPGSRRSPGPRRRPRSRRRCRRCSPARRARPGRPRRPPRRPRCSPGPTRRAAVGARRRSIASAASRALRLVARGDDHLVALVLGELARDLAADAAVGACHEGDRHGRVRLQSGILRPHDDLRGPGSLRRRAVARRRARAGGRAGAAADRGRARGRPGGRVGGRACSRPTRPTAPSARCTPAPRRRSPTTGTTTCSWATPATRRCGPRGRSRPTTDERALLAQIAGNEVAGRLGAALFFGPHNGQFWASIHCGGAAVAAGVALGLDDDAPGPRAGDRPLPAALRPLARLHGPGHEAAHGGRARGPGRARRAAGRRRRARRRSTSIESPRGLLTHFAFVRRPGMLGALGEVWLTDTLAFKPLPGCAYVQAAVEAALRAEVAADEVAASRSRPAS